MKIETADHVILDPKFEEGVDVSINENGMLEICNNTYNGRVSNSISIHPYLAYKLRDFLNAHLLGDFEDKLHDLS